MLSAAEMRRKEEQRKYRWAGDDELDLSCRSFWGKAHRGLGSSILLNAAYKAPDRLACLQLKQEFKSHVIIVTICLILGVLIRADQ